MEPIDGSLKTIMMDKVRSNPPFGVYLLAQIAREAGYEVGILDLIAIGGLPRDKIQLTIAQYDVLGISANSLN